MRLAPSPTPAECLLCGIDVVQHVHISWKADFKALYTLCEQFDQARITEEKGRRNVNEDFIPYQPFMVPHVQPEEMEGKVWGEIIPQRTDFPAGLSEETSEPVLWGFFVHISCWRLFQKNCQSFGTEIDIQALFDICRSLPVFDCRSPFHSPGCGSLQWGHGYDGLRKQPAPKSQFGFGWRIEREKSDRDPYEIELLKKFLNPTEALTEWAGVAIKPMNCYPGSDSFGALPTEVLCHIVQYLKLEDVANLRLASSTCASLSLSDGFWRSRFLPGRDFDWVFEAQDAAVESPEVLRGEWFNICCKIQRRRFSESLWNRERVWNLASWTRELMKRRTQCSLCHGNIVSSEFEPDGTLKTLRETDKRQWLTGGCAKNPKEDEFRSGVRTLYTRQVNGHSSASFIRLLVSCLKMDDKHYITGLEMLQKNGQLERLGYVDESSRYLMTWGEGHHQDDGIVGFKIALDQNGIRGLCAISCSGKTSHWIGDWEDIPKRILTLPGATGDQNRCISILEADFDALKLLRLTIAGSETVRNRTNFQSQHIWLPDVPGPEFSFLGAAEPYNSRKRIDREKPFEWVLFGGQDGGCLRYITKITVWAHDYAGLECSMWKNLILGIEFTYSQPVDGKTSVVFGERPDAGYHGIGGSNSVSLDMRPDERITQLEVKYRHEKGSIRRGPWGKLWRREERRIDGEDTGCSVSGLKITTNMGGVLDYNADHNTKPEEQGQTEILQVDKNKSIVGFFGILQEHVNFRNVGIIMVDDKTRG